MDPINSLDPLHPLDPNASKGGKPGQTVHQNTGPRFAPRCDASFAVLRSQYALHGSNEGAAQRVLPEILTNYSIFSLLVTLQVQGCSLSKMTGTLRVGRWKKDN